MAVLDSAGVDALPAAAGTALWFARLTPRLVAVVRAARAAALGEGAVVGQDDDGGAVVLRAGVGWVGLGERGRGREVDLGLLRRVGQRAVEAGVRAVLGGTLEDGAWRHGSEAVSWNDDEGACGRMVMERCARRLITDICRKTEEDGRAEDCLPRRRGGRVSDEMRRGSVCTTLDDACAVWLLITVDVHG